MQTMQEIVEIFANNGIDITPGGRWRFDSTTGKKQAIDASRKQYKSWSMYPDDNMGKHYIKKEDNILVVDIDMEPVVILDDSINIPSLGITLPKTLSTQTSKEGKYHLYYRIEDSTALGNRIVKFEDTDVDFFTYGNVFEPHLYSPSFKLLGTEIVGAPQELVTRIANYTKTHKVVTKASNIVPYSHVYRYNIVTAFLEDRLTLNKEWNAFFRVVFPSQDYEKLKSKRKITFESFKFSYTLLNNIAVKLSATLELGTAEHIRPALCKIVEAYGKNPNFRGILDKQILATLPDKEAQPPYDLTSDTQSIAQWAQSEVFEQVDFLMFRTIGPSGNTRYITLDKFSFEAIPHNNNYFLSRDFAEAITPQLVAYDDKGRAHWAGDNLPIVYVENDPFKETTYYDRRYNRNIVNLYTHTEYVKQAYPSQQIPEDNLCMAVVNSVVHPDYRELVLRLMALTVFGKETPETILWIAATKTDKGGTGKSVVSLSILSKILGDGAAAISQEDLKSGWGDMLVGARLISLEDMPKSAKAKFEQIYTTIKQSATSSKKRLNMKGSNVRTQNLNISITGSSNERLALASHDRRFLCLEPAHLRGHAEPLTEQQAYELDKMIRDNSEEAHYSDIQAFTNYLLFLANKELSRSWYLQLYKEAPVTPYRGDWISIDETHSQNFFLHIREPERLMGMVNISSQDVEEFAELLKVPIQAYNEGTGKTGLPWNWFREMLQYIMSDPNPNLKRAEVANMLEITIKHLPDAYTRDMSRRWKTDGTLVEMSSEVIQDYKSVIEKLYAGHYTIDS